MDSLKLPRVDFIKIDVEGMELEAHEGARQTIEKSKPALLVESIKAGPERVAAWLEEHGYKLIGADINLLAIHSRDPMLREVKMAPPPAS